MKRFLPGAILTGAAVLLLSSCGGGGGGGGGSAPGAGLGVRLKIEAVSPTSSRVDGGGTAVIRGAGFQEKVRVWFGEVPSQEVERISTAEIHALIPPAPTPGVVDLFVENPGGSRAVLKGIFEYYPFPAPRITALVPSRGNFRRPLSLQVQGSHFRKGIRLFLGDREIPGVDLVSSTLLKARIPPLPLGKYDVKVVNPDKQAFLLPGGYESAVFRDTKIQRIEYGLGADIFDQSLDPAKALKDVLVRPGLKETPGAWRWLPPDPFSGKERIQVLAQAGSKPWKDTTTLLQSDLPVLPPFAWGSKGTAPVLPRNAALRVLFDNDLALPPGFWEKHPAAVELLAIQGDPRSNPASALRPLPCRIAGGSDRVAIFPCTGDTPLGLPAAPKGSGLPNVRIAFPLEGPNTLPTLASKGGIFQGKDQAGRLTTFLDLRSGREGESGKTMAGGLLLKTRPPRIRALIPVKILSVDSKTGRVQVDKLGARTTLDPLETLYQERSGAPPASAILVSSSDTPQAPRALVTAAGAGALRPGPALLWCAWQEGKDDGALFVRPDPSPGTGGILPTATFTVDFFEPVSGHLPLSGWVVSAEEDPAVLADPKLGTPGLVPVKLSGRGLSASGAFSRLRITPLLGLFHEQGRSEEWTLHLLPAKAGAIRDLSGNPLAQPSFRATFRIDPAAPDRLVAYLVRRFLSADEDGTAPGAGAKDWWGNGRLLEGRLHARLPVRFQARTDPALLSRVSRGKKTCLVPFPLYRTPDHDYLGKGGLQEPFHPRGSRLQATWREDDLGLSRTDPSDMDLDVTGLWMAPFSPSAMVKETLDSLTLELSHCDRRPDLRPALSPAGECIPDPASFQSGLSRTFAENVLEGTSPVRVLDQASWTLDPARLSKDPSGRSWLPLPPFSRTFTWRDELAATREGTLPLGGCTDLSAPTADVESPWNGGDLLPGGGGFFSGTRFRDFPPPALPLLADFFVSPDDPARNGVFTGANRFRAAYVLPPWPLPGNGLYAPVPAFRAHTTAGPDPDRDPPVDPYRERTARGGYEIDGFRGTARTPWATPPTDDHLPWIQADFLKRVTVVTFGFLDLTDPGLSAWTGPGPGAFLFPDTARPTEFHLFLDPPPSSLPKGASLKIQWRGTDDLPNPRIWDPRPGRPVTERGNLLNPLYACDAERLAKQRILPCRLTPWVDDPSLLVDPATGKGPRYLCWRIVMESLPGAKPVVPSLDTLVLGYFMEP